MMTGVLRTLSGLHDDCFISMRAVAVRLDKCKYRGNVLLGRFAATTISVFCTFDHFGSRERLNNWVA